MNFRSWIMQNCSFYWLTQLKRITEDCLISAMLKWQTCSSHNYYKLVIIKKWIYTIKDGIGRVYMLKSLRYIEEITTWLNFILITGMVWGILVNPSWFSKCYCKGHSPLNNTRITLSWWSNYGGTFMKFAKGSGMSECILITIGFFHLRISVRAYNFITNKITRSLNIIFADKKYDVVILSYNISYFTC